MDGHIFTERADEHTAADKATPRSYDFETDGPAELVISLGSGRIEIWLSAHRSETTQSNLHVELAHDSRARPSWAHEVAGMVDWVNEQFGNQFGSELRDPTAEAVARTRIAMVGNRLVVHAPDQLPLRHIPLAVTVHAAAGAQLTIDAGSAEVAVRGEIGPTEITTGSGDVALETVDSAASIRTGSGGVALADACSGTIELLSGSGDIHVGVHAGTHAEVALSSDTGTVSSELDVSDTPPEGDVALRLNARTRSGRATVASAGSEPDTGNDGQL